MEFKLRAWNMDDLDSLVENANNLNVAKFMADTFPHPYTFEKGKAFIEMATKDQPIHLFAIEINGKAVGGIGIHPQTDILRKNAEIGYWLGEKYWGNSAITKSIEKIIPFAFETYDITRLFARVFGDNIASQKVLEKNNFVLEAHIQKSLFKNGEFKDEMIYAIRRK